MTETQQQVMRWMAAGATGTSSMTLALWLGFGEQYQYRSAPRDPADFDRCLRLLDIAPGLRPLLPRMAEVSGDWAALIDRWDEVEASHLAEVGLGWTKAHAAPKTYALMQSIRHPDRKASTA